MFRPFRKSLFVLGISILFSSCTSKDAEYTFNKKPFSSVESKDGNIVVHFRDNTTQSLSATQVEKLMKEKKIEKNIYTLFSQKIKEASARTQRQKPADEEQYPYKINGRDIHFVEYKKDRFTIHLADKTNQSFSQHEIDCMMINKIITMETYMLCMQKQNEEAISHRNDSSLFNFSYRKIECPEFN